MILFYLLAIVLIASAVFTVTQKSPVYSVVGLLLNFLTLAGLYVTLNAEFLGIIQIVVYSGAILILFVFVIALLSSGIGPFAEGPNRLPRIGPPALFVTALAFALIAFGALHVAAGPVPPHAGSAAVGEVGNANVFGSVADFGVALFTVQLLPFEVTAFVLMVAIVGVVMLAGEAVPQPTRGSHEPGDRKTKREAIVKSGRR